MFNQEKPDEPLSSILVLWCAGSTRDLEVGSVLTYDEMIEGPKAAPFPEELDFRFGIPLEVEVD